MGCKGDNLLHHGLLRELQGNLCSRTWSTSSPSLTLMSAGLFLTLFYFPFLLLLLFLKSVFPDASCLIGSTELHDGSSRAIWNPPVSGTGQPLATPHRGPCGLFIASTWAPTPSSTCQFFQNFEIEETGRNL